MGFNDRPYFTDNRGMRWKTESWRDSANQAYRISAFLDGYDRGNYGSAYESTDWRVWIEDQTAPDLHVADAWLAGVHFGYWSSYEDHEIPSSVRDAVLSVLNNSQNRQLCDAAGCVNRED